MNVLKIRSEMRNGKSIFDLPLRVTFYARVSTDKDEQLNSLENQVQYDSGRQSRAIRFHHHKGDIPLFPFHPGQYSVYAGTAGA